MCTKFAVDNSFVFLVESGNTHTQTHKVTDATDHPSHASAAVSIGNNNSPSSAS